MSTKPEITIQKLLITSQKFTPYKSVPPEGRGFVNWHFEDNRKDCLCESTDSVCWLASFTVKAFSGPGKQPDPAKDILLMEATASVEGEFSVESLTPDTDIQSLAWYFDETCKRKLLSKMRLLLLDTEFASIPLPSDA